MKKMHELKQLRESSQCTDTEDDSSSSIEDSNNTIKKTDIKSRRKQDKPKRIRRHRASDNASEGVVQALRQEIAKLKCNASEGVVQALRQEIAKLKCTQDQMEKYQVNLERDHRCLQRQLLAVDFSKQMTEMKNRELQQEIRDIVEDQLRFDNFIRHGAAAKPIHKMKQDHAAEIGLLQIENRILQQKLERCEQSLLKNGERRHLSMLADLPPQT
eukprot:CAMPEP_0113632310 /NCGR_PEP_ID=MMETSP0017_2-20120614/16792_1 /TAXON_ID=2856 /ORGANISM="Cylindrotheca closterium" /LENGTH=214 /DNA_ID=CAMNT_0000542857 /DNA_START=8 /DNA_END=652 /DNA_ORIENTATION=+ /assembly_acc=CAM_ASM_000147